MALFQATQYLKHRITSRSLAGHGVHSPFVYNLVTGVFPDEPAPRFEPIEALRKSLLSDQRVITVTDLGAGSHVHKSNERTIASIAKHSASSERIGRLLFRLAQYLNPPGILELGTSLGITTAYLAETGIPVCTVEGCPEIATCAKQNFQRLKISEGIGLFVGPFEDHLETALNHLGDCRMAFIDGNHTYSATKSYYDFLVSRLTPPAVLIFDDIYWSFGMKKAWGEIVQDPRNHVTIDLFDLGLAFIKPDQAKEHFSIKL